MLKPALQPYLPAGVTLKQVKDEGAFQHNATKLAVIVIQCHFD